jgi:NADH:ubiquinone reductase (H+-translocating)
MARTPHVLILGGGFVAHDTVAVLKRSIKRGDITATVVDRDNFLTFHGLVGEMVTGRIVPENVVNPARRIFAPAQVHVGEIESIDVEAKRVVTSRRLDGRRFELEYDYAVVGVGCGENLERYPGLAEHAFRLRRFEDCFRLKNHVIEMLELADVERDPEERTRLLTFFVAGGGFSGAELAGELSDFLARLTRREYKGIRRDECRVVIVHPGKTLLPELYGSQSAERPGRTFPKLVDYAMRHARKLGVELMLETKVVGVTPNEVYLSNGDHIPTRTIVSAVGSKPWDVLDDIDVPRDDQGRLITDEFLRVAGRDDLWAGGDCAAVPHPKGGTCPPVALFAMKHGRQIGRNLVRQRAGKSLKPFRSTVIGQAVSLGKRTAVGEVKGIPVKGRFAWFGWRAIIWSAIPSLDRRLRVLGDWALWPFVGRDIVQIGPSQAAVYDVRHHVYQEGETIAERARPGRLVHVIVEGTVDLVRSENGSEAQLESLGPGDHFGRKLLELKEADGARARSLVRTVALREEQANKLQDVFLSTSRIVAKTEHLPVVDADELEQLRRQRELGA